MKILMRSVKTSHRLLNEKVHEEQDEVLIMRSFMPLQRVYVFFLCFAQSLCFYALLRVYVLCFVKSLHFCALQKTYVLCSAKGLYFYVLHKICVLYFAEGL